MKTKYIKKKTEIHLIRIRRVANSFSVYTFSSARCLFNPSWSYFFTMYIKDFLFSVSNRRFVCVSSVFFCICVHPIRVQQSHLKSVGSEL